jgi:hypothetical protein
MHWGMQRRFYMPLAGVLLAAVGATCTPGAELGQGSGASYYGNRLACRPWGVLDTGQEVALSHALRLAIAAYVPGELSRCALSPAVQSPDGQKLSQHFGAVHLTVERNARGLIVLRFSASSVEKDFLSTAASFHGLPRFVEQDADTNPALARSVAPVFAPIVQQWLKVHRQAVFTQAESLGHRYLFVKLTQPYLLNNVTTHEEMKNVTAAGYVDCDFNRSSPGCITNTIPITQLSGVQPVPSDVPWNTFHPRITPAFAPKVRALTPLQRQRLAQVMQGKTYVEIGSLEGADKSAVDNGIGTALTTLGFSFSVGDTQTRPLRFAIATLLGTDFGLMENLLRHNPSQLFYHRFDTSLRLTAADFKLASLLALDLTREQIGTRLGLNSGELSRSIEDLRSRLGLPTNTDHTREYDIQLLVRLADLAMPHLPAPQASEVAPSQPAVADLDGRLISWLPGALDNPLVQNFLRRVYGTSLKSVIGNATSELLVDGQGVKQRFEYAELTMDGSGRLSAAALGTALRERIAAKVAAYPQDATLTRGFPKLIRLDWSSSADPKYVHVKRWAEEFRSWIAVWQKELGFVSAPGEIVEAYGHLFYLGGPVALVHCGYNPYSPGCSCNDSAVTALRSDNPMDLLPPRALQLLQSPTITHAFALPYMLAGFSDTQQLTSFYELGAKADRFSRFLLDSLGFANRPALLRHVYGIDFGDLAPGTYTAGTKQVELTDLKVQVLQGLSLGLPASKIPGTASDRVLDMNTQLGTNGFPSERLLIEMHRLTRSCASPLLDRNGGVLSGRGSIEPWTASFDASNAPLLRLDPKRGALVPSGEVATGQPTVAWATWKSPGSEAFVALTGSLADPRFIDMDHLSLGALQPTQVPAFSARRANSCPLLVPALPQRRLSPIGLAQLTTQPLEVIAGAFRYAKTGATTALLSDYCIGH